MKLKTFYIILMMIFISTPAFGNENDDENNKYSIEFKYGKSIYDDPARTQFAS